MISEALKELHRRVLAPDLNVRSGVYSAIDPSLHMQLSERGEYEYIGLGQDYEGPADALLRVSAFGGVAANEDKVASDLFPTDSALTVHPVLGRYRGLFAGYANEGDFRRDGSSGGLGTWILCELLRTGRVDGVVHLRPNADRRAMFSYQISTSVDEIMSGSGSRYYPGELSTILTERPADKRRYAVTAIPSIAYELRLLQRERPEYADMFPFIVGLVCGHQKTANYAGQLAWRAGMHPSSMHYVNFRKKVEGRAANHYVTELEGSVDGEQSVIVAEDLFGTDWGLGLFKSNFSDFTEDVFNETADVVLGDAWLPEYTTDSNGTNIVIVRNAEISSILSAAVADGRLRFDSLTPEKMLKSQGALIRQNVEELPQRFRDLQAAGEYVPERRRTSEAPVSRARQRVQRARLDASRASHAAWAAAVTANDLSVFDKSIMPFVIRYRRAQRMMRAEKALMNPRLVLSKLTHRLAGFRKRRHE